MYQILNETIVIVLCFCFCPNEKYEDDLKLKAVYYVNLHKERLKKYGFPILWETAVTCKETSRNSVQAHNTFSERDIMLCLLLKEIFCWLIVSVFTH